jgi:predicted transcriptional regulator
MSQQIDAGGASFALRLKDALTDRLKTVGKRVDAFGKRLNAVGGGITNVGKSVIGIGAKIVVVTSVVTGFGLASAKAFASFGDDIGKMSRRLGIATKTLQEYGFAAEQSGASLATVETGVRRMQRVINDAEKGMTSASDALAQIGLNSADLAGLETEQQFEMIAAAMSKVEGASKKAAIAQEIFGRSGTMLLPMFNEGPEGLAALREEANKLGLVLSDADIAQAEALTDSINRIGRSLKAVVLRIGASVAKPLGDMLDKLAMGAARIGAFVDENREMVLLIAKWALVGTAIGAAVIGIGVALAGVGFIISGIGTLIGFVMATIGAVITGVTAIVGGLAAAFTFLISPIGLVAVGVTAAIAALVSLSGAGETLGDAFSGIGGRVMESVERIKLAFQSGGIKAAVQQVATEVSLIWQIAVTRIKLAWAQIVDFVKRIAEEASRAVIGTITASIKAIATAVDELGKMVSSLINQYASVYDSIYNSASKKFDELADKISGTKRLGGEIKYDTKAFDRDFGSAVAGIQNRLENLNLRATADEFSDTFGDVLTANITGAQKQRESEIAKLQAQLDELSNKPVQIATKITDVSGTLTSAFTKLGERFADIFGPQTITTELDGDEASKAAKTTTSSNAKLAANITSFAPTFNADKAAAKKQIDATQKVGEKVGMVVEAVKELASNLAPITEGGIAKNVGATIAGIPNKITDLVRSSLGRPPIPAPATFSPASIAEGFASDVASFFSNDKGQTDGATEDTAKRTMKAVESIARSKRTFGK